MTPKNDVVELINDYILSLIYGEVKIYLSFDTPCEQSETLDGPYNILTLKLLNTIKAPDLPNDELKLKVGVRVMLLRNIDRSSGLCNGMRLIIPLSFAMTINKNQSRSLKHVGIYLPRFVFINGQLYVTIFRVTSRAGLKLLINDDDGNVINKTSSVV